MGSLENGVLLKKDNPNIGRVSSFPKQSRARSRSSRFLLSKRLGYLQWISTIVVFSLFLVLFQAFLPGSVVERPGISGSKDLRLLQGDSMYLKEIGELDFGEDVIFEPTRVLDKFQKEAREMNLSSRGTRFALRKPKLALVFPDLAVDQYQILMATVAAALREIGYSVEVFSSEDGPARAVWQNMGVHLTIVPAKDHASNTVDWLNYDGILLNSLEGKHVLSCLMQEPFKSLPLVWTIHEKTLASHLNQCNSNETTEVLSDWKRSFNRATVVVFPNYALPIMYSPLDVGNYFVIPGTPVDAWKAQDSLIVFNQEELRTKMGLGNGDFIVTIVGSHFMYKGLWLEHALILQSLKPLLIDFPSDKRLKIFILTGDSSGNYSKAVEIMSTSLKFPEGIVKHADHNASTDDVIKITDLVIYGSFLEEKCFPDVLIKAMSYEKLIVAPTLSMIRRYISDRVNGYLFPKNDLKVLTSIISNIVSSGKLSSLARNIASIGKGTAKNLMVVETVEGYASLLENILKLPSEVSTPKPIIEIPSLYKNEWRWNILSMVPNARYRNRNASTHLFLENVEKQLRHKKEGTTISTSSKDEEFLYAIWEEQKETDLAYAKKIREDDEVRDRSDQSRATWEDVYRNSKRADRSKNELHERDDGELERTGQPLCIYEPYLGEGTWSFLHRKPLYRGIDLATRARRPGSDDIDASARLPLLSYPYYRDLLGEFGAFLAIANRVDRVHKNGWIGFQSWRATTRKVALSKMAEKSLVEAIESQKHGHAFYFWARMDEDPRNPMKQDFWSFCDAINAGNCRSAFSDALKRMYGIKSDWESLPPMPMDGDTWSVMHSWSLPTRSFLEFVMFARMFVDTLDAQMYDEHHQSGLCYLSLSKDKHCYTRVLELLVNVWAYHSARKMVYINPANGIMQEQHKLQSRRGKMWIKWFALQTLKTMDEDLAEESDSNKTKRWLWPKTGEIIWQGVYEREKDQRKKENADRKKKSRDKVERIKNRNLKRQKPIGKYVKASPEGEGDGDEGVLMNSTTLARE